MNNIVVTGDTHGNVVERISFKRHPGLRELDSQDFLVILGDVGIMWPEDSEKAQLYTMRLMEEKPFNFLLIRGNHDNEPWWESCPPIDSNSP